MNTSTWMHGALALAASTLLSTAQANLLSNGGFDAPLGPSNSSGHGFVRFDAPNQGIPGWTLTAGSVEVFIDVLGPGTQLLDMTGVHTAAGGMGPGSLQQSFATTIGASYQVSFLMGGGNASVIKPMEVAVNGPLSAAYSQIFSLDSSLLPAPGALLLQQQFSFIANDVSSTIRFTSLVNDSWDGPLLDAVSVTAAVPETESWVLLLAGLGLLSWMRRRADTLS